MNLEILKNSGLRQKNELESILGVTRMSLFKYFAGRNSPRKDVEKRIIKLEAAIIALTKIGALPFNDATDRDTRSKLVKHLQVAINV